MIKQILIFLFCLVKKTLLKNKCHWAESHRRPPDYESGDLTADLQWLNLVKVRDLANYKFARPCKMLSILPGRIYHLLTQMIEN